MPSERPTRGKIATRRAPETALEVTPEPASETPETPYQRWLATQSREAQQAARQHFAPYLFRLEEVARPWSAGWEAALRPELERLRALLPQAEHMRVSWYILQRARAQIEADQQALDAIPELERALRLMRSGAFSGPVERLRPYVLALRRDAVETPAEVCRTVREKLEEEMALRAGQAERVANVVQGPEPPTYERTATFASPEPTATTGKAVTEWTVGQPGWTAGRT